MKAGMFNKGYKAVREEQQRREKAKEARKGRLWRFFLKKGEEDVPIRFLTEEPICFYEHSINEGGKWTNAPCIGDGCEYCDSKKPSYVAAWLVVDGREVEVDERDASGNKTGKKKIIKDRIKLLVRGMTTAGQLDRLSRKFGLMDKIYYVTRTGTGTDTVWNFDRGDTDELTDKQMKALFAQLPEELQKMTPDEIVEHQIMMEMDLAKGGVIADESDEDDSEDDKEALKKAIKSKVQKIDEEDTDPPTEEEEVPEEAPPVKRTVKKAVKKAK